MIFKDRADAGERLAEALQQYKDKEAVILALPRGGVVTGAEIAKKLHLPLDLIIVRKIGHPGSPEYAICAVTENNHLVCDPTEITSINKTWLGEEIEKERKEAKRRKRIYLSRKKPISLKGKTAIIVDDGIATGLTIKAATEEAKHRQAKRILVAEPVIPKETAEYLRTQVDEVIALEEPEDFLGSVGAYYEYFPQITDEEVISLMRKFG